MNQICSLLPDVPDRKTATEARGTYETPISVKFYLLLSSESTAQSSPTQMAVISRASGLRTRGSCLQQFKVADRCGIGFWVGARFWGSFRTAAALEQAQGDDVHISGEGDPQIPCVEYMFTGLTEGVFVSREEVRWHARHPGSVESAFSLESTTPWSGSQPCHPPSISG